MLREIYEQPDALRRTMELYLHGQALKPEVAAELADWPDKAGEILIAASGSSRHSGLYGEILLEDLCRLAVDVEYASEYSCRGGAELDAGSRLALELRFNLFQRLAFRLGQEEDGDEEVHHREAGEEEKHRRVAVLADEGKKDAGERG
jgi:hypothetical protein